MLAYFPDAELADGAAEAETDGFFDVNDTPPWDTWVALFSDLGAVHESAVANYLVSWVPPRLVEVVQRGIDVSMVGCIAWVEDTKTMLASRLHEDGFYAERTC